MHIVNELYEAATSDEPGSLRFPDYTHAPTDADAAAAGSSFVHLITPRSSDQIVVRFWCSDSPRPPVLRVDFEPLVAELAFPGGPLEATSELVASLIVATFFETYTDGWYRGSGIHTLAFRDMRDGARLTLDHAAPFDASLFGKQ